jgi:hypothetical protein
MGGRHPIPHGGVFHGFPRLGLWRFANFVLERRIGLCKSVDKRGRSADRSIGPSRWGLGATFHVEHIVIAEGFTGNIGPFGPEPYNPPP